MRRLLILLPAVLCAQTPAPKTAPAASTAPAATKKAAPAAAKPMTDDEKTIYALGLSMYRSIGQFDLSPAELEILKKSFSDAAAGKPEVDIQVWGPKIQALATARSGRGKEKQKAMSAAYLSKAAAEFGAQKTASGLIYKELRAGAGASPKATDNVKVNYRGTLVDGTEFDSSYKRNEPAEFPLNGVIKCWTEGVQKMKIGGKSRLVCPADLAYGDDGRPGIPGAAALIFEIELLQIGAPAASPPGRQ
ncbi:MAG: FKBP-type peptidyl-prolyl cis-trans isomerase [Bryobacteraceae bacterium]